MAIEIHGSCDQRFETVKNAFAENFALRGDVGASIAVVADGHTVVDLWAGYADEARSRPWKEDTIVCVYSATKGLLAMCALRLIELGLFEIDAPVSRYWPEFAQGGKGQLPVRYLLTHQAGLPAIRTPLPPGSHYRWGVMTAALAAEEPWWEPGTQFGYHALTFGWLVGELIRRQSGLTVNEFLQREVAGPLRLDFHIGIGPHNNREVADVIPASPPVPGEPVTPLTERLKNHESMAYKAFFNPKDMMAPRSVNTPAWRTAEIPAANGHSNARYLARVYGALARGGQLSGVRLLRPDIIASAVVEQVQGIDAVLGAYARLGLGFRLQTSAMEMGPGAAAFGHPGSGGALGFADPEAKIGFGYAMNRMMNRSATGVDPRWPPLIDAVYASLR